MMTLLLAAAMLTGQVGSVQVEGDANYANPSHGSNYLAMRLPRGTVARICAARCLTMTVNDYGPVVATGDIADIALVRFARICGWSIATAKRMGECTVTVEYGSHAVTLPPTSTEGYWTWPGGGPR